MKSLKAIAPRAARCSVEFRGGWAGQSEKAPINGQIKSAVVLYRKECFFCPKTCLVNKVWLHKRTHQQYLQGRGTGYGFSCSGIPNNCNGILYTADGAKRIADNALVALTLMIAESRTDEMEMLSLGQLTMADLFG